MALALQGCRPDLPWRLRVMLVAACCAPCGQASAVLNCSETFRVHQFTLGAMQNYQYLLEDGETALLVDATWDIPRLKRYIENRGLKLAGGLYTHGHFDHVGGSMPGMSAGPVQGAKELRQILKVERGAKADLWIGAQDVSAAAQQTGLAADVWTAVKDGDLVTSLASGVQVVAIDTPGHSAGAVAYLVKGPAQEWGKSTQCADGLLLTGDTVFIQNVGRTDLPGGSQTVLLKSLSRLSQLSDNVVVLSGHSYDAPPRKASLGYIRSSNQWMVQGIRRFPPQTLQALPNAAVGRAAASKSDL